LNVGNPFYISASEPDAMRRVEILVDYLFGRGASKALPTNGFSLVFSRRSGRLKLVYLNRELFATVKPNGAMALSIYGARILVNSREFRKNCVTISEDAVPFVQSGKSVFCKFVDAAGENVWPRGEVVVLDRRGQVVAVGTAVINGRHMTQFKSGVAVKVRQGAKS